MRSAAKPQLRRDRFAGIWEFGVDAKRLDLDSLAQIASVFWTFWVPMLLPLHRKRRGSFVGGSDLVGLRS